MGQFAERGPMGSVLVQVHHLAAPLSLSDLSKRSCCISAYNPPTAIQRLLVALRAPWPGGLEWPGPCLSPLPPSPPWGSLTLASYVLTPSPLRILLSGSGSSLLTTPASLPPPVSRTAPSSSLVTRDHSSLVCILMCLLVQCLLASLPGL